MDAIHLSVTIQGHQCESVSSVVEKRDIYTDRCKVLWKSCDADGFSEAGYMGSITVRQTNQMQLGVRAELFRVQKL